MGFQYFNFIAFFAFNKGQHCSGLRGSEHKKTTARVLQQK